MSWQSQFNIVCVGAGEMFQYCIQAILSDTRATVPAIFTWSEKTAHRMSRFVLLDDFSRQRNIRLIKVESMNDLTAIQELKQLKPDFVFVDGWSEKLLLPLLTIAPDRFLCIHPSLLPEARGGATLNWALIRGEKEWGVTLFYLASEIDRGDIIDQERFLIEPRDDIQTVFDKATLAAMDLLKRSIPLIRAGKAKRLQQDKTKATFLPRRKPDQGQIDWTSSAQAVYNLIRALTRPYPGAYFFWSGEKVWVWKAAPSGKVETKQEKSAGDIVQIIPGKGIRISCGEGAILMERVQLAGEPAIWADQWCQRHGVQEGSRLV